MANSVPTYSEYCQLRRNLIQLINDYRVLFRMNGVQSYSDLLFDRSENAESACQTAEYLITIVDGMDVLAEKGGLWASWPLYFYILKGYSGVHQSFQPMRKIAKSFGVRIANPGGRPRRFKNREDVLNWLRPQVEAIRNDGSYPSIAMVAGYKDCHENTIRLHTHPYWPDWETVLADLNKKAT